MPNPTPAMQVLRPSTGPWGNTRLLQNTGRARTHCRPLPRPHKRALVGETPTARCMGGESLKCPPKCLSLLRTDGEHVVIRNPLALCLMSHIDGGEHPPNFTVLGKTLCGALPAPAREGHPGAAAALVSSGTTTPLSRSKNTSPMLLGSPSGCPLFAVFLSPPSGGQPPTPHLIPRLCANPPPPIHEWRIPSSKGALVHTPQAPIGRRVQPLSPPPPPPPPRASGRFYCRRSGVSQSPRPCECARMGGGKEHQSIEQIAS